MMNRFFLGWIGMIFCSGVWAQTDAGGGLTRGTKKRNPAVEWVSTTSDRPWVRESGVVIADAGGEGTGADDVMSELVVDPKDRFQTVRGFGACFNELGWTSLQALPAAQQGTIFRELFSESGAHFTICRMPLGANDFSRGWYSYDETPGDFGMQHFSIDNDLQTLVPFIRRAKAVYPDLQLWASPWCPPSWMKKNGHYACARSAGGDSDRFFNGLDSMKQGQEGVDQFITEDAYFKAYALYFKQFLQAYAQLGLHIGMVMPQNEFNSCQSFPSCTWTAASLDRFVGGYLAPALSATRTRIFFGTMERENHLLADTLIRDPACHITGVGLQWAGKKAIAAIHAEHPDLELYESEQECGDGKNEWAYCCYTWDLMKHYFMNGVNAYMYWNISLAEGGVSHWGWSQNSLVVVDTAAHRFRYSHEYYLMKHLSHFVKPGSHRVAVTGSFGADALAFVNPDGRTVIVVRNADKAEKEVKLVVGTKTLKLTLKGDSFNTIAVR